MIWRRIVRCLLVVAVLCPGPVLADDSGRPLSLDDVFAAALRRSEVIATQTELIRQAEERYRQASGALLPTVSGVMTHTWQEGLPTGVTSTTPTNLSYQPVSKVNATQPLFRGFREFAGLRQTKDLVNAQNEDYQNARVLLFKDVVQNYYNVLSIEQDLRNLDEEIRQNVDREQDIDKRVRIGRSRPAELLNVQATISTLRAQVEQLNAQLQVARETFAFLTGLDAATPLGDTEAVAESIDPLPDYLAAVDQRPDVLASQKRLVAAQENVKVAQGAHLPSVDLSGNYYLDRPGYLSDVNWDVTLALTLPIYSGGTMQSKVREAVSQRTQAELSVSQIHRQAEQEVRSLYQSVRLDRAQVEALDKATGAARKSFEAQSKEYRLGLVTNLDVLQALTAFQENQRALDRVRFTLKSDYLRLLAATNRRAGLVSGTSP